MKNKLVVVTDLGLLKAYKLETTPQGAPRLEPVEQVVLQGAHQPLSERVTDAAGRHAAPTQKKWGAPMVDSHNLELESKRRLVKQIAGHIKRLVQRMDIEGCWLAAHKEINRQVLDELPNVVRSHIEKNLPLDLVKAEQKELIAQFCSPV